MHPTPASGPAVGYRAHASPDCRAGSERERERKEREREKREREREREMRRLSTRLEDDVCARDCLAASPGFDVLPLSHSTCTSIYACQLAHAPGHATGGLCKGCKLFPQRVHSVTSAAAGRSVTTPTNPNPGTRVSILLSFVATWRVKPNNMNT